MRGRVSVLHCRSTPCRKWGMLPPNLNHCDYTMTMEFSTMVPKKKALMRGGCG